MLTFVMPSSRERLQPSEQVHAGRGGFTLIELLVVIGILAVLAAVLLPNVLGGRTAANLFADQQNLRWHYGNIEMYRNRQKMGAGYEWPKQGGHRFVFAPWVKNVVDHTPENRDRYFVPGHEEDPRWNELKGMDAKTIWRTYEDTSSEDTHYAGRAAAHYHSMSSGNEALMADDNEGYRTFPDGTINMLMEGGAVRTLSAEGDLKAHWKPDDPDFYIEVGKGSPVPELQKLEH